MSKMVVTMIPFLENRCVYYVHSQIGHSERLKLHLIRCKNLNPNLKLVLSVHVELDEANLSKKGLALRRQDLFIHCFVLGML